ncbi:hypothetical protein AB0E78_41600 [Streptomyces sp. NPDC032198]|uniref:hypothetical protein n=1 Tax=unclassified Streptomyces TaxID=2593676 RepID=UPI003404F5FE
MRSDTRDVWPWAWGTSAGKARRLPAGFHVCFLQTMDEARRDKSDLDRLVMAKWVITRGEWQWLVVDIEDLGPHEF